MSLWKIFSKGLIDENPILVLALSLCPALAVTSSVLTALTMGLTVTFVISMNNIVVSIIRKFVNPKVRVPVYITSIATIVTLAILFLQAFAPELYQALGIYLSLVVVFAIILARAESFASKNPVFPSFLDGLGMGMGFTLAMITVGAIRELFGNGTLLGFRILGSWYNAPLLFVMAPGAFFVIAYLVGLTKIYLKKKEDREREREAA
ncbi:electron transport complex subunit RsxE [Oscillospiraceae bacterium CM]|nr:electron transport complex subunit RsxE [Oscillospiraceae bacterium CM]